MAATRAEMVAPQIMSMMVTERGQFLRVARLVRS